MFCNPEARERVWRADVANGGRKHDRQQVEDDQAYSKSCSNAITGPDLLTQGPITHSSMSQPITKPNTNSGNNMRNGSYSERRPCDQRCIGSADDKNAMRQVDDVHDAEDEREADRRNSESCAVKQSVDDGLHHGSGFRARPLSV